MKKKRTGLIVAIILILIILIAGGVFAYIYFATDLLKSEKELFAKYFTQMGNEEYGFNPTSLLEYENRKLTEPYQNNGQITANTQIITDNSTDPGIQEILNMLAFGNNTNISFSGMIDNTNSRVEENIQINYSDSVNLPITFKQDGDIYGLRSDSILPGYMVAIENNNLSTLLQNLGATDVTGIPDRIEVKEFESLNFTDEEKVHLVNTYITPMYNNISEDKFTKANNADGSTTYMLTLSYQELKGMITQMLQTLSTDTMMINKINSILSEAYQTTALAITASDIQSIANNISSVNVGEGNVIISITSQDGLTNKISINIENVLIEMTKSQTASNLNYEITISEAGETSIGAISMKMSYTGLNTNSVSENITMNYVMQDEMNMSYNYTNNVTFGNNINIQPLDTNSTILLNNYSSDQLLPFLEQIGTAIAQVNESQMTQIGYPTEMINPIVMWFVGPTLSNYLLMSSADNAIDNSNLTDEVSSNVNGINTQSTISDVINGAEDFTNNY